MRLALIFILSMTACRPLLPPPKDLDAYCRRLLAARPAPVPPECTDTAETMERQARGEFTREEELERLALTNPYAACLEWVSDAAARCRLAAGISSASRGINEAFSGVKGDPNRYALALAVCMDRRDEGVELCKARHPEGVR